MPLLELGICKDITRPEASTSRVGDLGEAIAADYLRRNGYRLVMSNFRVPIGRNRKNATITGEIDIIALDCDTLCFVEVKTRSEYGLFGPLSAVDRRKQRQIIRTAKAYRRAFHLEAVRCRFDAVGIVLNDKRAPAVELQKGYFSESAA